MVAWVFGGKDLPLTLALSPEGRGKNSGNVRGHASGQPLGAIASPSARSYKLPPLPSPAPSLRSPPKGERGKTAGMIAGVPQGSLSAQAPHLQPAPTGSGACPIAPQGGAPTGVLVVAGAQQLRHQPLKYFSIRSNARLIVSSSTQYAILT